MAATPLYKFKLKPVNAEGVTFASISRNPRIYKPQDLQAARENLEICSEPESCPDYIQAMVQYLTGDFLVLLHRTGLYNRQKSLWESLTRTLVAEVFQVKGGLLGGNQLPAFDFQFLDYRQRPIIWVRMTKPDAAMNAKDYDGLFNSFLATGKKLNTLAGVFFCCPKPFPSGLRQKVERLTRSEDPVGRYESLLPEPLCVPINLLEMGADTDSNQDSSAAVCLALIHPDLTPSRPRIVNSQPAEL